MLKKMICFLLTAAVAVSLAACRTQTKTEQTTAAAVDTQTTAAEDTQTTVAASTETVTAVANVTSGGVIETAGLFTDRDLLQTADLTDAVYYTLSDGQNITVTAAGVYVFTGSAANATVIVDAGDNDKVQLVLNGVSVTNTSFPCIYVKNADKVFVTTTQTENSLSVTGAFTADGSTNTDAAVFSKDDLVLNGLGTLTISSTDNGISCKDDLKITGGTIVISCVSDALEANDSIAIADGSVTVTTKKDGLHAEYDEDNMVGYVYICGGTLQITAADDGIHATTYVQIDGGNLTISAAEGIEGTYVQVNGGEIDITAVDDGINAGKKSNVSTPTIEINGGYITINMGAGDTDGIDANGNLYINGGTVDVTAQSPFDYDNTAEYNGGTIIVNGEVTNSITNQMMGGMAGGMAGGMPGNGGWGGHG